MIAKYMLLLGVLCLSVFATGCGERKVKPTAQGQSDDCKYIYERKVDGEPKENAVIKQADYVIILFSASGKLTASHNFALFAKVRADKVEESVTISWMPKSMKPGRGAEPGVNLDIQTTVGWARNNGMVVERFGPYYCTENLYQRAKTQVNKLNTGFVQYKLLDNNLRPDTATNSVHAISDILCNGDRFDKFLVQTGSGNNASAVLKTYFEREGFIDGKYKNENELLSQFEIQHVRRFE